MPLLAAYMVPHPPLIIPDVGRGSERVIEETIRSYEEVGRQIGELAPDTILISSPHATMYADYFHLSPGAKASGSFAQFRAPHVSFHVDYDTALVREIEILANQEGFPAGTMAEREKRLDHGTMVPLYFIRKYLPKFQLVRIGLSGLPLADHYHLGMLLSRAIENTGRRAVFVASGDLSHKLQEEGPYGFAPEGPVYDEKIMDVASRAAFGELFSFDEAFCRKAAECGHRSFVIMAGVLDGKEVKAHPLSHQDVTGVGYGICTFTPEGENEERHFLDAYLQKTKKEIEEKRRAEDAYVRLARETIEAYILTRRHKTLPEGLPEELTNTKAGVFVSLHKMGQLRGCIGTILPTRPSVAEEIMANAISASTSDPRFSPVEPGELSQLEISVDVLSPPEKISSTEELDVKRYGVIVSRKGKRGLLLPNLEGVDTVAEQVAIARQKAGIGPSEEVSLERFEVIRHF